MCFMLPLGRCEDEACPLGSVHADARRRVGSLRASKGAVRATVDADVPEVHSFVAESSTTDRAVLRVGDMLQGPGVESGILHSEKDRPLRSPPETRDQGVVGVQDYGAAGGQVGEGRGYDLGGVSQFPVAVELVAEQVQDSEQGEIRLGGDL